VHLLLHASAAALMPSSVDAQKSSATLPGLATLSCERTRHSWDIIGILIRRPATTNDKTKRQYKRITKYSNIRTQYRLLFRSCDPFSNCEVVPFRTAFTQRKSIGCTTCRRTTGASVIDKSKFECSRFCFDQARSCLKIAQLKVSPAHRAMFIRMANEWEAFSQYCNGRAEKLVS
jgi:hypothetical protein